MAHEHNRVRRPSGGQIRHSASLETSSPVRPAPESAAITHGQALDSDTRSALEPVFGHNFADVRIHADSLADELSQDLSARAFALGNDVFFAAGQYAPETRTGQHLLVHELVHVVQRARFGAPGRNGTSQPEDTAEVEARGAARAAVTGQRVTLATNPSAMISREGEGKDEEESLLEKAFWMGAPLIPGGLGEAGKATHEFGEAMGAHNPLDREIGVAKSLVSTLGVSSEMGEWVEEIPKLGKTVGGLGLVAQAHDVYTDVKKGDVGKGLWDVGRGATKFGELIAPGATEAALAAPELGAIGGMGAGALAASGGLVLSAGGAGWVIGDALRKHTEVGKDSEAWLESDYLGGDPTDPNSRLNRWDRYRQEQWDKGGLGYLTGTGAAIGEGGISLLSAVAGLEEGILHGEQWLGEGIAHGAMAAGEGIPHGAEHAAGWVGSKAKKLWDWL